MQQQQQQQPLQNVVNVHDSLKQLHQILPTPIPIPVYDQGIIEFYGYKLGVVLSTTEQGNGFILHKINSNALGSGKADNAARSKCQKGEIIHEPFQIIRRWIQPICKFHRQVLSQNRQMQQLEITLFCKFCHGLECILIAIESSPKINNLSQ